MTIFHKIWAFVTNQKLVWLVDSDEEMTLTFAKEVKWSKHLVAKRMWPWNIRNVQLLPDQSCKTALNRECYVRKWFYA